MTDALVAQTTRARVFLSYSREDRAHAERLVAVLEAAGHEVWWDGLLTGGAAFGRSIEAALDAADAVVVLWSRTAVASHWVRDEAQHGVDRRRLVPLTLDGTEPPLGFRQFQVLDVRGWDGRADAPEHRALLRALDVVRGAAADAGARGPPTHAGVVIAQRPTSRRTLLLGGAALAVVASAGGLYAFLRRGGEPAAVAANGVVVLPFRNLSGNASQDYFADGLSAEVRAALARNAALRVIAQVSSDALRARDADAVAIARTVGVAFLLDGNVRVADGTVRIAAELIDGRSGFSRWNQVFDRPMRDVLAVQSEIAATVEAALERTLAPSAGAPAPVPDRTHEPGGTDDVAAFDEYLRGRALYNRSDGEASDREALARFEAAIARDPRFAAAHAARSRSLTVIANQYEPAERTAALYAEALKAARTAVELAPDYADAHSTLAFTLFQGRLDVAGAREPYENSRRLGAGDATVMGRYALYCALTGRSEPAFAAMTRAAELDPLNPLIHRALATVHYAARDYEGAIAPVHRALALSPKLSGARALLANVYYALGRLAEARTELRQESHALVRLTGLAIVERRLGADAAASAAFDELVRSLGDAALYQQAQVLAQWGDAAGALARLERAHAAGDSGLVYLRTDPLLDPLRGRPEMQRLLATLGFA